MPTQQFWNQIIDARWRWVWKRKNPWFYGWKNLRLLAEIDELRLAVNAQKKDSTKLFLLSANAVFLLNEGSKKKKSEGKKLYLLQKQAALRIYPHPVWPLPVWLGGHYAYVIKPGYPLQCPIKAQFWIISHLHLAVCTT